MKKTSARISLTRNIKRSVKRNIKRRSRLSSVSAAIIFSAMLMHGHGQAAEFSNVTFFGDSLTDTGFFKGIGRQASFTTNPDPVWAINLARRYGLPPATPAQEMTLTGVHPLGGNNYAAGGARVSNQDGFPDPFLAPFIPTITKQIDLYLAANSKLDKRGLYALWGGANDVAGYLQSNLPGLLNPATQAATLELMLQQVRGEATNLSALIQRLQNAGAGTILLPNLPDLGRTPTGRSNPALTPILSKAANDFNRQLNSEIARLGGNIAALNNYALFNEMLANPQTFGFVNVTDPACTTSSSSTCTTSTLVAPNANRTYLFADGQHPTGAVHLILAQYAFSVLQAPRQIGMLAEAPLTTTQAYVRAVDTQLNTAAPQTGEVAAFANYERGQQNVDQQNENTGLKQTADNLSIGLNYGINPDLMVGASLGKGQSKSDFSMNTGRFKFDQLVATAYLQYKTGDWKFHSLGLIGKLDYNDVQRRITLGPALRTEHGDTKGNQYLLRVGTRYDIDMEPLVVSPLANITWQQIKVDGYSEKDSNSTSMRFQSQTRDSLVASLGLEASTKFIWSDHTVSPYFGLTRDVQLKNKEREVRANVIGMSGSFGLPTYNSMGNSTRLSLGLRLQTSKNMMMHLGYATSHAKGENNKLIQAALGIGF